MMTLSAAGAVSFSFSGWLKALADETADNPQRRRACILLWMNGGASQIDTFDMKPGRPTGGLFRPIQSKVTGLQVCEYLPKMAGVADKLGSSVDQPPIAWSATGTASRKPANITASWMRFTHAEASNPPAAKYAVTTTPPITQPSHFGRPTITSRICEIAMS